MKVGIWNDVSLNPTHCATYMKCADVMDFNFIGVDGNEQNKLGKVKLSKAEWYDSWVDGVPYIQVGMDNGEINHKGMQEIKKHDLVEVCEPWFTSSAQIAEAGVPIVVFTYENLPFRHATTIERNAIQTCADACAFWTVATDMAAVCWSDVMGIPREKIAKAPRAIDCDKFKPAENPEPRDKVRILLNGRITWTKGGEDLIFAAKALSRVRDDFEICFIGREEGAGAWYRELITELGLRSFVKFLPGRDYHEMPSLYHDVDIVCILSIPNQGWHEQWCYSHLEAMASGLPVVGTLNDGAMAQVPRQLLLPPNRHDILAYTLNGLIEDADGRKNIGAENRRVALEHFNAETRAKDLHEFYKSCI